MNDFTTVFIITQTQYEPSDLEFASIAGIVFVLFGIMLFVFWYQENRRILSVEKKDDNQRGLFMVGLFFNLFGCVMMVINVPIYLYERNMLKDLTEAYNNQQYQIAEGTVHVLRSQPKGGHAPGDLIRLGKTVFEIDYYTLTVGYKDTISHSGALTEGTYAKVFYKGKTILRVDVKESNGQSTP